jgi:hypothetical protein
MYIIFPIRRELDENHAEVSSHVSGNQKDSRCSSGFSYVRLQFLPSGIHFTSLGQFQITLDHLTD